MKKMILLLCIAFLCSCKSKAQTQTQKPTGPSPDLYCKIISETDAERIKVTNLYLTMDEGKKPLVHLEGISEFESSVPDTMKYLDTTKEFGSPSLIMTQPHERDSGTDFQMTIPVTVASKIDLLPKDGNKDSKTGEMRWLWKEPICFNGAAVDVNGKDQNGKPYLIELIRGLHKDEEIAKALRVGADPNLNDKEWGTPLSNAAAICSPKVVQMLLDAGAKVDDRDGLHKSALGYSALTKFARKECVETAEILIKKGASVKGECDVVIAASKISATNTESVHLMEKLIDGGAEVDCQDPRTGATPLINASFSGNVNVVKTLLAKGADPNEKMNDGATALKIATENNDQEMIKLLKAAGAK